MRPAIIHPLRAVLLSVLTLLLAGCGVSLIVPYGGEPLDQFPLDSVVIKSHDRSYPFTVWVAATEARRSQGLTHVRGLDADRGMLFLFDRPTRPAIWMKNMAISLDLLFISADGEILSVAPDVAPDSPRTFRPDDVIAAVIELPGGTAARLQLEKGGEIRHPHFIREAREALSSPPRELPLLAGLN